MVPASGWMTFFVFSCASSIGEPMRYKGDNGIGDSES